MPIYTYRREDGTTFNIRQSFSDDPLTVDPETGQEVYRVIQPSGIIFKGSGFYVTDNRGSSHSTASNGNGHSNGSDNGKHNGAAESKTEAKTTTSSDD